MSKREKKKKKILVVNVKLMKQGRNSVKMKVNFFIFKIRFIGCS